MGFSIKWVIIRRFVELIALEFFMSFIMTSLNIFEILTINEDLFLCLAMCVLIFLCVNLILLRKCFFDLRHDFTMYYVSNYAAYAIFGLINVLLCGIFPSEVHTWVIAIAKFLKYSSKSLSAIASVLFFLGLGIILILIAPLGMKNGNGKGQRRRIKNVY